MAKSESESGYLQGKTTKKTRMPKRTRTEHYVQNDQIRPNNRVTFNTQAEPQNKAHRSLEKKMEPQENRNVLSS